MASKLAAFLSGLLRTLWLQWGRGVDSIPLSLHQTVGKRSFLIKAHRTLASSASCALQSDCLKIIESSRSPSIAAIAVQRKAFLGSP